jgi:acyl-CoA reductase-like NAD-dependent aldehyde dehydrogenase
MLRDPRVKAVSFTGSSSTGQQVAALCAAHGKTLQAELGGNNAAVVTAACDIETVARDVANAAFSFAGQRCTAVRRVIVDHAICESFTEALIAAIGSLPVGLPAAHSTRIGPLVSRAAQQRIAKIVASAREQGATVHVGGRVPIGFEQGCWYEPTLLSGLEHQSPVVQTESFGPVLVRSEAADIDDALQQVNTVEQGLTAICYSDDPELQRAFVESAETGVVWLQTRPFAIDPRAPFGGWKASGIGPPEHGEWDRIFYARPQAVYGSESEFER